MPPSVPVPAPPALTSAAEAALCADLLPRARLYFLRHLPGPAGEDAAQEAMVILLAAVRTGALTDPEQPGAFLYGVCRNLARDRRRTTSRRERILAALPVPDVQPPVEPRVDPQRLWQCLNLLGERARDVVLRTFVQGEGGPEIAVAVGISEANVRAIRHRAVVALRDCVHEGRP